MTDPRGLETSLAEMERKLRELQRELALVSQGAERLPPEATPQAAREPTPPPLESAGPLPAETPPAAAQPPSSPAGIVLGEASARVAELGRRIDELTRMREDLDEAIRILRTDSGRSVANEASHDSSR